MRKGRSVRDAVCNWKGLAGVPGQAVCDWRLGFRKASTQPASSCYSPSNHQRALVLELPTKLQTK